MIIIKTANGDSFINEAEVKAVNHDNRYAAVMITFKDGKTQAVYQVESMKYTNKNDTEIRDDGLMMDAVSRDAEYYHQMDASATEFIKRMDYSRSKLEQFILAYIGKPDEPYAQQFIKEIQEERQNRPHTIQAELDEHRTLPYYSRLRKDSKEHGDATAKEFARLTAKIEQMTDMERRYREANERLMKRNLWQRIINKTTWL